MSRIRSKDRALALTRRSSGALWFPEQLPSALSFDLWDQLLRDDKDRRRLVYVERAGRLNRWASATAIGERRIRFDPGFLAKPVWERAATQTHEHRHTLEYPRHAFYRARYVFDDVFRWANECQGVAAELWCGKAQRAREEILLGRVERLCDRLETPWLEGGYDCQRIRDVRRVTLELLGEVIAA